MARRIAPGVGKTVTGALFALLWDIGLPVVLYYALRSNGVSEVWAILGSGLPPALRALYFALRHRRVEGLGIFIFTVVTLNAALALLSGDARALLIRGGWVGLLLGTWMLASLAFASRPFTYRAAVSLLPGKAEQLDHFWNTRPGFRRLWRRLAVLWGTVSLGGCVLNIVYAYVLPVDSVPLVDTATQLTIFIVLQIVTQIAVYREGSLAQLWGKPRGIGSRGSRE